MAFFPRDERDKNPPSSERKDFAQERNRNYPNVEQGLIAAATLSEDKDKRLKWIYAAQPSCPQNGESQSRQGSVQASDVSRKRLKYGKQLSVFPSTCPIPWNVAPTSIQQRAEQGVLYFMHFKPWIFETNPILKANFLRTYLPDVEIPEELIRDQLVEDTTLSRTYECFDPYLGNLLELFEPQNGNNSAFLIFPTGETHRDLSESPTLGRSTTDQILFPQTSPKSLMPILTRFSSGRPTNPSISLQHPLDKFWRPNRN
jgi:hypothetical protein